MLDKTHIGFSFRATLSQNGREINDDDRGGHTRGDEQEHLRLGCPSFSVYMGFPKFKWQIHRSFLASYSQSFSVKHAHNNHAQTSQKTQIYPHSDISSLPPFPFCLHPPPPPRTLLLQRLLQHHPPLPLCHKRFQPPRRGRQLRM